MLIGTDVARHGSSSHNGGRFTPPGRTADRALRVARRRRDLESRLQPAAGHRRSRRTPNGSDYFLGGVTKIQFDPTDANTSLLLDVRLRRSTGTPVTGGVRADIFVDDESPTLVGRRVRRFVISFEFAASRSPATDEAAGRSKDADRRGARLIYLGAGWNEGGPHGASRLYRTDCVNDVDAADLTTGGDERRLDRPSARTTDADPGFGSFDFCQAQCSYDMFVETPPGRPEDGLPRRLDAVRRAAALRSAARTSRTAGRSCSRPTGGVDWTDMTGDATPRAGSFFYPYEDMHPDQHAIVFNPANPDLMLRRLRRRADPDGRQVQEQLGRLHRQPVPRRSAARTLRTASSG